MAFYVTCLVFSSQVQLVVPFFWQACEGFQTDNLCKWFHFRKFPTYFDEDPLWLNIFMRLDRTRLERTNWISANLRMIFRQVSRLWWRSMRKRSKRLWTLGSPRCGGAVGLGIRGYCRILKACGSASACLLPNGFYMGLFEHRKALYCINSTLWQSIIFIFHHFPMFSGWMAIFGFWFDTTCNLLWKHSPWFTKAETMPARFLTAHYSVP